MAKPSSNNPDKIIFKGLDGVYADVTAISEVHAQEAVLTYRGYRINELAEHKTWEEVAYLIWHGELPNAKQLANFIQFEKTHRNISPTLSRLICSLPSSAHPMDRLRTAISFMGCEDIGANDHSPLGLMERSVLMFAKLPTIVATIYRTDKRMPIIEPNPKLDYIDNFFHMTLGGKPDPVIKRAFDVSMTLYAEHSFNASTFAARVVTSTLSDIYSAVTAGIGALRGPLHGGANEAVMGTLQDARDAGGVDKYLAGVFARKEKVIGFGHRVYKNGDSRVPTMTKYFHNVAKLKRREDLIALSDELAAAIAREKNLFPNLDYPAGPTYALMGFPESIFTPMFVMSRITGWTAHVMEQLSDNRIIRPLSAYNGQKPRKLPKK
ncbi:MAG TPA: bifunctional 2-methylcitrate synthase/citrate synthase [Rhodospirillaceae bacterium]|nr:bifunctional 2-methylcitrate synthase/citrate synthase [Rhodospirillaceae bacterium]